jgi:hypothetical protein
MHTVPTAKEDWYTSVVVDGSSDRAHCYFHNADLSDGYQRTYAEGTGLETMPSAGDTAITTRLTGKFGKGVSYDDGATRRVRAPYLDNISNNSELASAKIDSGDTPGAFTSDTDIAPAADCKMNFSVVAAMAADGTELWAVFGGQTAPWASELIRISNADDAGWSSETLFDTDWGSGEDIDHVSANVYTRAGTKRLAVVVLDGTTVRYDEYDVSGAAAYSITGAVTVTATVAATMVFNQNPSITGDVTVTATPAATMLEGRVIAGAHTVTAAVAATMQYARNFAIAGAVTVSASVAAVMVEGRVIAGAVTVAATPAAAMVEGRTIVGDVTVTATPASTMLEGRTITGDVTVTAAVASGMVFGIEYLLAGDVTVTVSPVATVLDYTRNADITGDVTVTATPSATMLEGRVIAGALTVTAAPASAMVRRLPARSPSPSARSLPR